MFSCIKVILFWLLVSYVFLSSYSNARLCHSIFSYFSSRLILSIWYILFSSKSYSIFSCDSSSTLTLLFSCRIISSAACLTIELFYFSLLNLFIVAGLCPRSCVGLIISYLETKSSKTFYSYDKWPGTCMRHDLFQPKTDFFPTRALIWVHFKTVRYFSQPIFSLFSYFKKHYTI